MTRLELSATQASNLSWLLSINARRDLEKERDAYRELAKSTSPVLAERADLFERNAAFCDEMLTSLEELRLLLDAARAGLPAAEVTP